MSKSEDTNYELSGKESAMIEAPKLDYAPPSPKKTTLRIALIGCGGIAKTHLEAYRSRGWSVVALCDVKKEAARALADEFYPEATIYTDYRRMLESEDVSVVDIALHPEPRAKAIRDCLEARKHVLSQKPFVLDLEEGRSLARLADEKGVKLAVNQNGRWAPYVSYALRAIEAGILGEVQSVNISIHWDHTWCKGTAFEKIHHLVLYDFAIHWFDMTHQFFGGENALSVFAQAATAPEQSMKPPMLAAALLTYRNGVANLSFDGHCELGNQERVTISGSKGIYRATGGVCSCERVELYTEAGESRPELEGKWFVDGFAGSMGELLCAIEEEREPRNGAWNNLESLAVCFAAIHSADTGAAVKPGEVVRIEK